METNYKIAYLADHPEHIETVGRWYWEQWDRYEGWDIESSIAYAREGTNKDKLDMTLIALNDKNECLGTIQLMQKGFCPGYDDLTPWAGGFYVAPPRRGGRLAFQLLSHLKRETARLGIRTCYAFTSSLHRLFLRNGGRAIGDGFYAGKNVTVYEFEPVQSHGTQDS